MGRMRGVGIVVTAVVALGFWFYGRSGHAAPQAYCNDVANLSQVLASAGASGGGPAQAARLGGIETKLHSDGASLRAQGKGATARGVDALASDVAQWRRALLANDAVGQTVALDRTLSEIGTVGC